MGENVSRNDSLRESEGMERIRVIPAHLYGAPVICYSGVWQPCDHRANGSFKTVTKKSAESGGGQGAAAAIGGWTLTLAGSATGRPADWTIAEAKLAPELKGSRLELIERTIRDTIVANMNTTNHSAEMVQRGFELYRAINDSNGVSDKMFLASTKKIQISRTPLL